MRQESTSGVGIAAVIGVLLLGLAPILYFLSLGPAVLLVTSEMLDEEAAEMFYAPLILLAETCRPAEVAMQAYIELWEPVIEVPTVQYSPPMSLPAALPAAAPSPPPANSY